MRKDHVNANTCSWRAVKEEQIYPKEKLESDQINTKDSNEYKAALR